MALKEPSPFFVVTVPDRKSAAIESASGLVTYGWCMIPVHVRVSAAEWTTSLWPTDGRYVVPSQGEIRKAEGIDLSDTVTVELAVDVWARCRDRQCRPRFTPERVRPSALSASSPGVSTPIETWSVRLPVEPEASGNVVRHPE